MLELSKPHDRVRFSPLLLRIISLVIVSIIVTVLVVSFTLFTQFEEMAQKLVFTYAQNNLALKGEKLSEAIDQTKSLAAQIYFDPNIYNVIMYRTNNPYDIGSATRRIDFYQTLSPMLDSIYVFSSINNSYYSSQTTQVASADDFADKGIGKVLMNLQDFMTVPLIFRTITDSDQDRNGRMVYSYVFSDYSKYSESSGYVILNLKQNYVEDILSSGSTDIVNDMLIRKDDTYISFLGNSYSFVQNSSVRNALAGTDSGFMTVDENGKPQLLFFAHTAKLTGCVMVSISPRFIITKDIDRLKADIVIFVVVILLASLLVFSLLSGVIYRPISLALAHASSVVATHNRDRCVMKNIFLQELILGRHQYSESSLLENCEEYGIHIGVHDSIRTLLFIIDRYSAIASEKDAFARKTVKEELISIAYKIFEPMGPAEVVDISEGPMFAVVLSTGANVQKEIQAAIIAVQNACRDAHQVSMSAAISSENDGLRSLPMQYQQVLETIHRRFFTGAASILSVDDPVRPDHEYVYPKQIEKHLEEALRLGKPSDAKKYFDSLLGSTESFAYQIYQSSITAVVVITSHAASTVLGGLAADPFRIIMELEGKEFIDDVRTYFYQLFDSITEGEKNLRHNKHGALLDKIFKFVQLHYKDPGLCLNSVAENVSLSPAYLGKIFKATVRKSVADYINEVRLEKAKQLLQDTNLTVNDILSETGFASGGYFYTQFKKTYGLTPRDYRRQYQHQ